MKAVLFGATSKLARFFRAHPGPAPALYLDRRQFDLTSTSGLDFLDGQGFTHAFLALGDTNLDRCFGQWDETYRINVEGLCRLIDGLRLKAVTPVFYSTDQVFDGLTGSYREDQVPRPLVAYGRQKLEVEKTLLKGPGLVLRLSRFYGTEPGDGSVLADLVDKISRSQVVTSAREQVATPVFGGDVVHWTWQLVEQAAHGLFHLGGPEELSRPELYRRVHQHFSHLPYLEEIRSLHELGLPERRPENTGLDSTKLQGLVQHPGLSIDEAIERLLVRRAQ